MNRSLLIVICDFLLLSLLALARFDQPADQEPQGMDGALNDPMASQDMIEVLRLSLASERDFRMELDNELSQTREELEQRARLLAEREKKLKEAEQQTTVLSEEKSRLEAERAQLEAEKNRLESERVQIARQYEETRTRLQKAEEERLALVRDISEWRERSAAANERLQNLEKALRERERVLSDFEQTSKMLESERRALEMEKQALETQLAVARTEARALSENLNMAISEIEVARAEKAKLQEQTSRLTEGVTILAESTRQIQEEVKQLQPQSMNAIFDAFHNNRVTVLFLTEETGLFGGVQKRQYAIRTILLEDGERLFAPVHVADTPLVSGNLKSMEVRLVMGGKQFRLPQVAVMAADPRIVSVVLPKSYLTEEGPKPFKLSSNPLRFPEAVLIDSQESYYGESTFRIDEEHRGYMRMQNTLFNRLFGEFSPKRGDLIFSKTGEWIGLMVNGSYGAIMPDFSIAFPIRTGSEFRPDEANQFNTVLRNRLQPLGRDLQ